MRRPGWVLIEPERARPARGRDLRVSCRRCGESEELGDLVAGDARVRMRLFCDLHRLCPYRPYPPGADGARRFALKLSLNGIYGKMGGAS